MKWLNGWNYNGGGTILLGSSVRCIGCGSNYGVTCVVIPDDVSFPEGEPDWPFLKNACPVCELKSEMGNYIGEISRLKHNLDTRKRLPD